MSKIKQKRSKEDNNTILSELLNFTFLAVLIR